MSSPLPVHKRPEKLIHHPKATDAHENRGDPPTTGKHRRTSSQIENCLRRAKKAGLKVEEVDWEVVAASREDEKIADEDWVLVK